MRFDEGRKGWSLRAIETNARTEVGKGKKKKTLLSDPGSELRLLIAREKEKVKSVKIKEGMNKTKKKERLEPVQ